MKIFGLLSVAMASAGDALAGAGGGGSLAVIDAPATDLTTSGGGDDGGDGSDAGDATTDLATTDAADATDGRGKSSKPALALLKQHPEHVAFANDVDRALASRQRLRSMFPGQNPFKAIETLQRDIEALAGQYPTSPDPRDPEHRTGIQQVRDKLADLEQVDLLYYAGDAKLLDGMTSDDDGKAAFAKLAPAMIAKYRELAPNAYAAWLGQSILASMKYDMLTDEKGNPVEEADIPLRLRRLAGLVPADNALAHAELNALWAYLLHVQGVAKLAPEKFVKEGRSDDQISEREKALEQREQQSRANEWGSAKQQLSDRIATREWNALTKGRTITPDDQQDVMSLFHLRLARAIKTGKPNHQAAIDRMVANNDRAGYLAYMNSVLEEYVPSALKAETTKLLNKLGTKAKPVAATDTAAQPGGRPTAAQPGFRKLNSAPSGNDLAPWLMTKDMVRNKQGVLRDGNSFKLPPGTKVSW